MKKTINTTKPDLFETDYYLYCDKILVISSRLLFDIFQALDIPRKEFAEKEEELIKSVAKERCVEFTHKGHKYTIIEKKKEPVQLKLI